MTVTWQTDNALKNYFLFLINAAHALYVLSEKNLSEIRVAEATLNVPLLITVNNSIL